MTSFESELAKLNPQQREAVETIEGPVLVIAGPGTGKTQVLATRIANILKNTDAKPENILCITFTEAGVAAMRNRLFGIIGKDAYYVNINTYHGFCNQVIQSNQDKFPEFGGRPTQLNDLTRVKLLRSIIDELTTEQQWELIPYHDRYYYVYEIGSAIQTLKREGVDSAELEQVAKAEHEEALQNPKLNRQGKATQEQIRLEKSKQRNVELARIYQEYQRHLVEQNYYDYEDMIMSVVDKFGEDEDLLHDYLEQYHYILVDEYQDTNGAQNDLVALLGRGNEGRPNMFAVGDDDQAIFRFQGANVENVLFFNKQFRDVKVVTIETNYRSSQSILDAAQAAIDNNSNRLVHLIEGISKKLTAGVEKPKYRPEVYRFSTGEVENRFVIKKIQELHEAGTKYSDIAIIYRQHKDADDLIEDMLRAGLPLNIAAGGNSLDDFQVSRLIKLLNLILFDGAERENLLFEVIFYDFIAHKFGYSREEVFKLVRKVNDVNRVAKDEKIELFDELEKSGEAMQLLRQKIIEWRNLAQNQPLSQFVAVLLEESGFLPLMLSKQVDVAELNAVNSFFSFIKNVSREDKTLNLKQFMADMDLMVQNNLEVPTQSLELFEDGVNLMTAHGAKGLEFENVFIIKCYDKHWGGKVSRQIIKLPNELINQPELDKETKKDIDIQDERRLFYVAVTRAKQRLILSSAESYLTGSTETQREESRFVGEIKQELLDRPDTQIYEETNLVELVEGMSPIVNTNLADSEKAYLSSLVNNFRLSASALNEYLECPLKFKFNRLLRVPLPASKHLALGNATHYALEGLNRSLMEKSELISLEQLQERYKFALNQESLGGDDYQETLREGSGILNDYYTHYKEEFTAPEAVEYHVYSVPLEVPGAEPIMLTGKIDRVEWVDEEAGIVKVVDYKTSKPKSENEIRGLTKNSEGNIWRQLVFYRLLADLDPNFRPEGKMQPYKVRYAEVDFLKQENRKFKRVELEITDADVEELKALIIDVMNKIRNLEFYDVQDYPNCKEWEMFESLTTQSILNPH